MKPTSSLAQLKTPGLSIPLGKSPLSATMRRTPAALYRSRNPPMLARVPSMQDRCGAASMPVSVLVLITVSMVPERVVPPAPKVTEKNAGPSDASGPRAAARFSSPAGVLGGNSSTLKNLECLSCVCMNFPHPRIGPTDQVPALLAEAGGDRSTCIRVDMPTISRACMTPCTAHHRTTNYHYLARPKTTFGQFLQI